MGSLSPNRGGGEVLGGGGAEGARGLSLSAGLALSLAEGLRRSPQRRHVERSGGPSLGGGHQRHYNVVAQVIGRSSLTRLSFQRIATLPLRQTHSYCPAGSGGPIRWPGSCRADLPQGACGQNASDLFRMAVQGALGVYANQILFLFGVELTDATTGSVCNLTLPVFAAAIGMCTGRESFRWQTILGLCFCLAGALLMKLEAGPREGGSVLGVSARPPAVPSPTIV